MDKILYVVNRFREPSSWAAITAVLALVGYHVDDSVIKIAVDGLTMTSGILGVFISEAKPAVK